MGNTKILKKHAKACPGILIVPLKRPKLLNCCSIKPMNRHGWQISMSPNSLLNSGRNFLQDRYVAIFDVDSTPRPLPCQSVMIRLYNNSQDRGDCQNTRKSYKTALTVGWSVDWKNSVYLLGSDVVFYGRALRTYGFCRLVSKSLVYDIEQLLTLLESFELRDEKLHCLVEPVGRIVGAMRRK
jgi:hypothetical protein